MLRLPNFNERKLHKTTEQRQLNIKKTVPEHGIASSVVTCIMLRTFGPGNINEILTRCAYMYIGMCVSSLDIVYDWCTLTLKPTNLRAILNFNRAKHPRITYKLTSVVHQGCSPTVKMYAWKAAFKCKILDIGLTGKSSRAWAPLDSFLFLAPWITCKEDVHVCMYVICAYSRP